MFTDEQIKQLKALLVPIETRLGNLVDGQKAQGQDIAALKAGQERLELKIAVVNERVSQVEASLKEAIRDSQQDTIAVLTEVIHSSYGLHEQRIQRIEDTLHLPPLPTSQTND